MTSNNINVSLETKKLKDKDEDLVLKFSDGVIPTGGVIKIIRYGKVIEQIKVGSPKTIGGVYHTSSYLSDYPYNWIALENYEIFKHLANHENVEIDDKTEEDWAYDLRTVWNVAINGQHYRLDKDEYYSADEYYNYHITTPEYTPGVDKGGMADIVISPLGGIKQLTINPSNLQADGSYQVDLSNAGLLSAAGDLNSYLKFNSPLNFEVVSPGEDTEYESRYDDDDDDEKVFVRELSLKKRQSIAMSEGAKFSIKEIDNGNFAIANNKRQLKKLSLSNVDVVYCKKKGKLYLNDNLTVKGWADNKQDGLLANFKNKPDLSKSNFDSLIDYVAGYDQSGSKYDDTNWFLNAYRNTPQKEIFSLFDGMKEIELRYNGESASHLFAKSAFQNNYVNTNAWKILWTNSPDKGPAYRNGISSNQYDAFKASFGWRGDAEMLSQGKEQYIFF